MVSGKQVLLISAEPREFAGLVKFCRNLKPLRGPVYWARQGDLNGRSVLLVANGVGGRRAGQGVDWALKTAEPDQVWSVGFCGGLESGMGPGEVFVAKRVQGNGGGD